MRDLMYSFKELLNRNRDGGFATKANRKSILSLISRQLYESGFNQMKDAGELKGRHVNTLVALWQKEGISDATMKNRMSALRWWAKKVGKQSVIARDNAEYGIANRVYVTNESKAFSLDQEKLNQVSNESVKFSLELHGTYGPLLGCVVKKRLGFRWLLQIEAIIFS